MNEKKKQFAVILLLCIAAGTLLLTQNKHSFRKDRLDTLKVTILQVGKADAIVVQNGDETMVIDAGEEEDGEEVVSFLTNQGIQRVDTLIITHFDRDHVGGADTIVENMEIGQVLIPNYQGDSIEYADFMEALENQEIIPQRLNDIAEFKLGAADVLVEPPVSYEVPEGVVEYDNNLSLITTVTHGEKRLLFAGDIEKQGIRDWIAEGNAQECDFLKVPHHGVYSKATEELLEVTTPEYAVICSSNKNAAETKILDLLKKYDVRTLETKDGNVTVISDGYDLEVLQTRK